MSPRSKEVHQINWERALHDVRHIVCKHLKQKDLCSLSRVNKSWCQAASHEQSKRFLIQQIRLLHFPYQLNKSGNLLESQTSTLLNSFYVKPYASLMIIDRAMEPLDRNNVIKEKWLRAFKKVLPGSVMILKVDECLTSKDKEERPGLLKVKKFGVLGLFFPNTGLGVRVNVAWHSFSSKNLSSIDVKQAAARLALDLKQDLGENSVNKSALLLFAATDRVSLMLAYRLCESMEGPKETIWVAEIGGSGTGRHPVAASAYPESSQSNEQCILALRISGPDVESWTAVIGLDDLTRYQILSKLRELKEKVKLKRFCTAMFIAPCEVTWGAKVRNSYEIMSSIKYVFPDIQFVGLFRDNHLLALDSVCVSKQFNTISLIIITYN